MSGRGSHKLLVPFFTVGYPDYKTSLELARAAFDSGADIVELGMPFSDPLADGPEIQYSSHIALKHKINLSKIRGAVEEIRKTHCQPLVAMGYFNPILSYGPDRFMKDFSQAGLDGLIIPDLPVDESKETINSMAKSNISSIFLVSPTSDNKRIGLIDSRCTDFVYAVTVTGVTGAGRKFGKPTFEYLRMLKNSLKHPFVAGFGVSTAEDARQLTKYADGVVIGSALIRTLRGAKNRRAGVVDVAKLLALVRKALS